MESITSTAEHKNAIPLSEVEQPMNGKPLKLNDTDSSPGLIDTIFIAVIGLATGYLVKKIVVRTSKNIFRILLGSVLQIGVTSIVAQHPGAVKSAGKFVVQKFHNKNKLKSRER